MRAAFHRRVRSALADPALQHALDHNADRRQGARLAALATLPNAETTRREVAGIRRTTLDHLDVHLATLRERLAENGWQVHDAASAKDACRLAIDICHEHGATRVAKSKSMVTEEIKLNPALERAGIEVVETDLGEYIVQLRGEPPAHIISPIVHLTRQDVGALFESRLGIPYTDDVATLNAAARRTLRPVFLDAQVGISGANFAVAETGTLVLVTNEGNGRLVTQAPPVHIAFVGIERVVPALADLPPLLQLLPRSATGQKLTSYVSLIQAPRAANDADGPIARHIILVDNGRTQIPGTDLRESLACIRCGACLNACPVYREIGGHAYDSVYPGPIGSVISPGLFGLASHGHLAKASSLCGACREVCPADIDLPTMLLRVRRDYAQHSKQTWWLRGVMRAYAWAASNPRRFRLALRALAWGTRLLPAHADWVTGLPGPLRAWTSTRHFPHFQPSAFRRRVRRLDLTAHHVGRAAGKETPTRPLPRPIEDEDLIARFQRELETVGGEVQRVSAAGLPAALVNAVHAVGASQVFLAGWQGGARLPGSLSLEEELRRRTAVRLLPGSDTRAACVSIEQAAASVGVTAAVAALADTGTILVASGPQGAQDASLLPGAHVAILSTQDVYPSLSDWLERGGRSLLAERSSVTLITGPSRTADIEMTLTIGVHGPARLIVLVCEGASQVPGEPRP